ncbi:MAG: hypothetical protein C4557_02250 [Anaerolineaceae bacterium]|nr:MAG: hypothetical protein C4557_02250 [Anaerolineaceae bacterium]
MKNSATSASRRFKMVEFPIPFFSIVHFSFFNAEVAKIQGFWLFFLAFLAVAFRHLYGSEFLFTGDNLHDLCSCV